MKHVLLTAFLLSFADASLSAQQLINEVVSSGGGSGQTGSIQLDWTLGDLAVQDGTLRAQRFTEGFQQPVILIERVDPATKDHSQTIEAPVNNVITLSPNPVSAQLTIHFEHAESKWMKCQVLDARGNPLFIRTMNTKEGDQFLDLSTLAPGLAFVQFISENDGTITVFKLVKI